MSAKRTKVRNRVFGAILSAALLLTVSVWQESPSAGAAVPKLDNIRVALFIEATGKYRLNTATASFSSTGGLKIGMRTTSAVENWLTAGKDPVRFAVDDYKVKLIETTDFNTALSVAKRVQALGGSAVVTTISKSGKSYYVVLEGSYSAAADAKTAMDKWTKDSSIASLMGSLKASLTGPLHLEGGSYTTEAAARNAVQLFSSAGIDAYPAIRKAGTYSVMVGAAADATALAAVKTSASKVSGAPTLREADASTPYLLLRDDNTISGTAKQTYPSYSFPASSAKVWVSTDGGTGIKLQERSSRTYRGSMEVSAYNGKMAVVNELPFEQYLYSVVPSEMPSSWASEALKAQAVAARSYALYQGMGFGIAHVNDTELSQVYSGMDTEKTSTTEAVNATAGMVAMYNGKPIEALFSSNAGGQTADATEIWGNAVPYLKSVPSPDQSAENGLMQWYRVVVPSGAVGYIREDLLDDTGRKNAVGATIMITNADGVKVRDNPVINDAIALVDKLARGTEVVLIEQTVESNKMSWVLGPYTSDVLQKSSGWTTAIRTLDADYGESGRVIGMSINGSALSTKSPVNYRTLMGGLPSTRFTIDETARVQIAGANGATSKRPEQSGSLYIAGANGKTTASSNYYVLSGDGTIRAATVEPKFRFVGYGNGHGVGLSQYGAQGLAQLGYDYVYIMKYYYNGITIEGQ
ncbi:stage II sporulation protein D [Paenibacillus cellulosilyticus]|uniref:Stage II sporulation protein D n=1 Tax=Paenibacillus cellulosilyticus TaxID=375489 RepID=A0A2V2YHB1_9BACL|nr:SpoIID/LytB domain-containing protein [Paenibacillus cellulosilyticus]PWV91980.1 stage II sporulation protein D [Paenibacillus cellulosilyticus]QKS46662.1 SpoIID/LytB domain-containing protein [Paenibacillus cellulosilyticus]